MIVAFIVGGKDGKAVVKRSVALMVSGIPRIDLKIRHPTQLEGN